MTYAADRICLDADSHVMEPSDFLVRHADPLVRERVSHLRTDAGGGPTSSVIDALAAGAHTPATVAAFLDRGDQVLQGPKYYEAVGAFNPTERSQVLDLLGFHKQLVFATFSTGGVLGPPRAGSDPAFVQALMRAHNRAMAEFCADDSRLMGIGVTNLDDPDIAVAEIDHIADLGLSAVWIPHRAPLVGSPGHVDLDPVWARLVERDLAAVLHIGGSPLQMPEVWIDNGEPQPDDWLGGAENVRAKDMVVISHAAERFLGVLILDRVLERFPGLRIGTIELGAGWVPELVRRLDHLVHNFKRFDPALGDITRLPSEQMRAQMAFTPFVYEDVGTLIRQSHPDLYLFSSDFPHAEGGRDPLGRFEATLEGLDQNACEQFFHGNFERVFLAGSPV